MAEVPEWLFDECYDAVGDLAETAALLYPNPKAAVEDDQPLASWVENRLARLRKMPEPEQKVMILDSWNRLNARQRFVWNKIDHRSVSGRSFKSPGDSCDFALQQHR